MSYLLQYGGYTFPGTMRPAGGEAPADLAEQERPRADGSSTQIARQKSRILTIRGEITAADADSLNVIYEAMRAACAPGQVAALYHGRDDRYVMAQAEGWTTDYSDGMLYGVVTAIAITFRAKDPAWFDATATTPTLSSAGGTIVNAGTAPSKPVWTITIGTGGTGSVTLTNSTTGETATIIGTFTSGDVIVIDRAAYTVKLNGVANFGLLTGRIPEIGVGSNTIAPSASTVSIASLACSYTARRY
ncbi:hypothetical protein CCAX7_000330 [Capsulimonas corticalis]|uniref:Siphovirus-type tail component C-terminal domain-containing protein n=1 Tax=Capsulimonas corticalis TaxID=2219043 RepID=A0A402CRA0_9BACT|nr:phage tail domain-containing protein [Capsulimonas corticalis]BDI27982.1 hypothetical protein CCAX7_000330 [Capsulimonas corticalis]